MNTNQSANRICDEHPPAISGSGGHNTTFALACKLARRGFSESEVRSALDYYNNRCKPQWSSRELDHKAQQAMRHRDDGPLTDSGNKYVIQHNENETIKFLKTLFAPEEYVGIAMAIQDDDGWRPQKCVVQTCEQWVEKIQERGGWPYSHIGGTYICVNAWLDPDGKKTMDNVRHKYLLVEFDDIDKQEQMRVLRASGLPCKTLVDSGKKSIHAIIEVNAENEHEYKDAVETIYDYFEDHGIDRQNSDPCRLSRLAGAMRDGNKQALLAVQQDADARGWIRNQRAVAEVGHGWSAKDLVETDIFDRSEILIGEHHFLRRGGSMILIGPSGQGKSTLIMQMAIQWALGEPFLEKYLPPERPLKSLIIQAENDQRDVAEAYKTVSGALDISPAVAASLPVHVVPISEHVGDQFIRVAKMLIDYHKPDLVWVDPLLSYVGGDVSRQEFMSPFIRNKIQPILSETGVGWIFTHHCGKPKSQQGRKVDPEEISDADLMYEGLGSSDLTNWARAIAYLQPLDDVNYALRLCKRGGESGVQGRRIYMRHSDPNEGKSWKAIDKPQKVVIEKKPGRTAKATPQQIRLVASSAASGMRSDNKAESECRAEAVAMLAAQFGYSEGSAKKAISAIWGEVSEEHKPL